MSDRGDSGSEMHDDPSLPDNEPASMDDQSIEALFASPEASGSELGQFLAAVRSDLDRVEAPAPNAKVAEYVAVGLTPSIDLTDGSGGRRTKLAALVGTAAGKVLLGAAVAVAAVGGFQGTGAVDIPLLPGGGSDREQIEVAGPADEASSSTSSTSEVEAQEAIEVETSSSPTTPVVVVDDAPDSYSGGVDLDVGTAIFLITPGATPKVELADHTVIDGWTFSDDSSGEPDEVEVSFTDGTHVVRVTAEFDDGQLRIRTHDDRDDSDSESYYDEEGELDSPNHDDDSGDHSDDSGDDSTYDDGSGDDSDDSGDDSTYDDSSDDGSHSGSDDSDHDSGHDDNDHDDSDDD